MTAREPLAYLTDADWAMLRAHAAEIQYERDAAVVREGSATRGIMVLRRGTARVEQAWRGVNTTLTRMVPGEVFGEMSLLDDAPASASVIADEPAVVELYERAHVEALLQSDPGFASRFYRSIAAHLSRRLRESSRALATGSALAVARAAHARPSRLGEVTSRQLPRDLVAGVDAFKQAMATVEARPGVPGARSAVEDACGRLVGLLDRHTRDEALFEIGYADLGAFRDPTRLALGIGAYVFRQTFSWFMSAATIARAYMKPRGIAEDHETLELIYTDDPDGDGALGPLLDGWFLARPVCRARRAGRERARALLREAVCGGRYGPTPSVASLAGRGTEAIELLTDPAAAGVRLTCIDGDHDALASGAQRARALGVEGRVTFTHGDVAPASGGDAVALGRLHVAYGLGLVEYLTDDACVRLLDAVHAALVPGGTLAIALLTPDNPDRLFMEHILEWRVTHRSEAEIAALFQRSRFAAPPRVEPEASGAGLFVVATKGSAGTGASSEPGLPAAGISATLPQP